MNARNYLGLVLVALPFIGIFVFAAHEGGILAALGIFGFTAALMALVGAGVFLMHSD